MKDANNIHHKIFELQMKIEHAENLSLGTIEEESRIDDLQYELLRLEEGLYKNFK